MGSLRRRHWRLAPARRAIGFRQCRNRRALGNGGGRRRGHRSRVYRRRLFIGAAHVRRLLAEARRREEALAVAKGALADHITARFADWGLTAAESDVALFALKGCDAAEIAALRGAAQGTVRAQLSQVYTKAGVTSQAGLVSLFLDDLL